VKAVPAQIDGALFVLIGIAISTQPLLYGMTRQLVDAQNAGKALSAINLAFFLGAALMHSTIGIVATIFWGRDLDRRNDRVSDIYLGRVEPTGRECAPRWLYPSCRLRVCPNI
jgi:hypothetical protein